MGRGGALVNSHGCVLDQNIVTPRMRQYRDCSSPDSDRTSAIALWLVLEEFPGECGGYQVVYSEESGQFGLAIVDDTGDLFLGFYGSLLDAFHAM